MFLRGRRATPKPDHVMLEEIIEFGIRSLLTVSVRNEFLPSFLRDEHALSRVSRVLRRTIREHQEDHPRVVERAFTLLKERLP